MPTENHSQLRRTIETGLRFVLVLLLIYWCFEIAQPFLQPIVWGIVLAIATQPVYAAIRHGLKGREGLAAAVLVVAALAILIVPAVMLTTNVVESATSLSHKLEAGALEVPPPPAGVADWPVIGERVHALWAAASTNLEAALEPLRPQLKALGRWTLHMAASGGVSLLLFALSIILAGVLLASGESPVNAARQIAERVVPGRGPEFVALAGNTVQSVTRGILGTAVIQTLLASAGLLLVGVPAFGLWALLILVLAVVQLPTLLVLGPIIVWVFASHSTAVGVLFAIWSLAVGLSDNVLKPLLLGRGSDVPMVVIFIGAIGGFIQAGIIGLFVGAVVLCVGHALFKWWLESPPEGETA